MAHDSPGADVSHHGFPRKVVVFPEIAREWSDGTLFRQQFTRAIPPNAERVTLKGKNGRTVEAVRFKDEEGKTVTAPLTRNGDRCRVPSPVWYGEYSDADGIRHRVPLCANKAASEQMLTQLLGKAGLGRLGMRDPFEAQRLRPLAEHLADFHRELSSRNNAPRYVDLVISRLRALLDGCAFHRIADLSASRAADWLADLRRRGRPAAELPAGQEWFTPREAAALLGIWPLSVGTAVRRLRLDDSGQGPALPPRDRRGAAGTTCPRRQRTDHERLPVGPEIIRPLAGEGPAHGRERLSAPGRGQREGGPPARSARTGRR